MKTYQDLLNSSDINKFVQVAVNEYLASSEYRWAREGTLYYRQQNSLIMNYRKMLYKLSGQAVPDIFAKNQKLASNYFKRFIVQEVQYLLGNGATFNDLNVKEALGGNKFDYALQKIAKKALVCGRAYGFWNFDHLEIFDATEFVPLFDEYSGALKAGIRFWQLADNKPIHYCLYEIDGVTHSVKDKKSLRVVEPKHDYKQIIISSSVDGTEIYENGNYDEFPIKILWANDCHQSMLVGIKEQIDAYDLIKSGAGSDLEEQQFFWIIKNCGGMDDLDLARFRDRLKTVKAAVVDSESSDVDVKTVDIPYQAREAYLTRLEEDLYNDSMSVNVQKLGSSVTATAIRASYEPLEQKATDF